MDVFKDLVRVFPFRGTEKDQQHAGSAYFKALKRFPLDLVAAGAEKYIATNKHFPKPVEWQAYIPARRQTVADEVVEMTADEAREWHRADVLRYEDAPCICRVCTAAGIHTRPIRYVPERTADDVERKVLDPTTNKVVTAGHWAHGEELVRWYRAKEHFWTEARKWQRSHAMPATTGYGPRTVKQRIDAAFDRPVVADREPGEEG